MKTEVWCQRVRGDEKRAEGCSASTDNYLSSDPLPLIRSLLRNASFKSDLILETLSVF